LPGIPRSRKARQVVLIKGDLLEEFDLPKGPDLAGKRGRWHRGLKGTRSTRTSLFFDLCKKKAVADGAERVGKKAAWDGVLEGQNIRAGRKKNGREEESLGG